MSKDVEPSPGNQIQMRTVWIIVTVVFTVIVSVDLFQWAHGKEKWEATLAPIVILLIGATQIFRIRGMVQKVIFAVCAILAVLALVTIIIQW